MKLYSFTWALPENIAINKLNGTWRSQFIKLSGIIACEVVIQFFKNLRLFISVRNPLNEI